MSTKEIRKASRALGLFEAIVTLITVLIALQLAYFGFSIARYAVNDTPLSPQVSGFMPSNLYSKLLFVKVHKDYITLPYLMPDSSSEYTDWDRGKAIIKTYTGITYHYSVNTRSVSDRVRLVLPILLFFVVALVGAELLRRVVHAAVIGDPFASKNVARLRWFAGIVAVCPIVLTAIIDGELTRLARRLPLNIPMSSQVSSFPIINWFVIAIMIWGLAEIFKRGAELRENEELTV